MAFHHQAGLEDEKLKQTFEKKLKEVESRYRAKIEVKFEENKFESSARKLETQIQSELKEAQGIKAYFLSCSEIHKANWRRKEIRQKLFRYD